MKNKAFTMADRRSSRTPIGGLSHAFTMAEILISLTIIGVIAALTLPALMANLNEKVWNTKRKTLHSRMAQALAAMPNLDRYLESDDNSAAYNFIQNGLATAYNITKICNEDNMSKCDFAYPERDMNDEVLDSSGWEDLVSFNTVNGESLGLLYYNSTCGGESNADFMSSTSIGNMECATFLYDLNGAAKGPNKVGKDMGLITAFFPEYPLVIAPMPVAATGNSVNASEMEDLLDANSEYRLPSPAEATVLLYYSYLIGNDFKGEGVWTDNNVICDGDSCEKASSAKSKQTLSKNTEKSMTKAGASSAYLILVSKDGDAPKKFKQLDKGESTGCDKDNLSACKNAKDCTSAGGTWIEKLNGGGMCTNIILPFPKE